MRRTYTRTTEIKKFRKDAIANYVSLKVISLKTLNSFCCRAAQNKHATPAESAGVNSCTHSWKHRNAWRLRNRAEMWLTRRALNFATQRTSRKHTKNVIRRKKTSFRSTLEALAKKKEKRIQSSRIPGKTIAQDWKTEKVWVVIALWRWRIMKKNDRVRLHYLGWTSEDALKMTVNGVSKGFEKKN